MFSRRRGESGDGSSATRGALRDAEVEHLDLAAPAHEDVRRLDVAMDDAALVGVREPSRDGRADDGDHLGRAAWASSWRWLARLKPSTNSSTRCMLRLALRERVAGAPMFGCESVASTRASRSSCAANGESGAMVFFRTLSATVRPERLLDGLVDRRQRARAELLENAESLDASAAPPRVPFEPGAGSRADEQRVARHLGRLRQAEHRRASSARCRRGDRRSERRASRSASLT